MGLLSESEGLLCDFESLSKDSGGFLSDREDLTSAFVVFLGAFEVAASDLRGLPVVAVSFFSCYYKNQANDVCVFCYIDFSKI